MAHWLFKSEPDVFGWDALMAAGPAGTPWEGVRNHLAKQQMMAMRVGERGFFYHSNAGKAIVGLVEVVGAYAPDATDATGRFGCVTIAARAPLARPVTLAEVKAEPALREMALVASSRLSVQPVRAAEWKRILAMGAKAAG